MTKQTDKRDKADGKSVTKQTEKAGQSGRKSVNRGVNLFSAPTERNWYYGVCMYIYFTDMDKKLDNSNENN